MLFAQAERRLAVADQLARVIPDERDADRVVHLPPDILRARSQSAGAIFDRMPRYEQPPSPLPRPPLGGRGLRRVGEATPSLTRSWVRGATRSEIAPSRIPHIKSFPFRTRNYPIRLAFSRGAGWGEGLSE